MSKSLDISSRSILEDRPSIDFVEPAVIATAPTPIPENPIPDIQPTLNLAANVSLLAEALQNRVDIKAADMQIDLDPQTDALAIAAMRRQHPDADPTVITYAQYKECKDRQRAAGAAVAEQGLNAANNAADSLDTQHDKNLRLIEPLDLDANQDFQIRMLVNHIWKSWIKKILKKAIPVGLPNELAPIPKKYKEKMLGMGAPLLGEKKKKTPVAKLPSTETLQVKR